MRWYYLPLALLVACASDTANDVSADTIGYDPDDLPAPSCATGGGGTGGNTGGATGVRECETSGNLMSGGPADLTGSSGEAVDACDVSDGCDGARCVAVYDPELQTRGVFECVFTCVPELDDASWCADDSACCDAKTTCNERGYCVPQ